MVRVCKAGGINSRFCHLWTSLVESTADSARGTTFQSHGNATELVQNQPFQLGELAEGAPSKIDSAVDGPFTGILVELSIASQSSLGGSHIRPPTLL
ncbi:unnamed protein product [Sphagnum jensenii]|uniref:Uncharacterized protein n=1 Tax=Sphagnum jensenii TaxID=128206 RepID=A0ABP1BQE9_9BRYO